MGTLDWPEADSNGYSEAPDGYLYGANPRGFLKHLVVPEPYNVSALCGMTVAETSPGAILRPHGRSHVCATCLRVLRESNCGD